MASFQEDNTYKFEHRESGETLFIMSDRSAGLSSHDNPQPSEIPAETAKQWLKDHNYDPAQFGY